MRVLFVLTSNDKMGEGGKQTGYYLPELAHPYYALKRGGVDIDMASPKGGASPCDASSIEAFAKDKECIEFLADEEGQKLVKNTKKAEECKASAYDAVFWVGGHGPMWDLYEPNPFHDIARKVYEENNGVVAAVCHGPIGITNIKLSNGEYLIKGKKVCAFTNAEEEAVGLTKTMPQLVETEMGKRGATFVGKENWAANVQVDSRVITGQNPASAGGVGEAILKAISPTKALSELKVSDEEKSKDACFPKAEGTDDANKYKTWDNDTVHGMKCPDLSTLEYLNGEEYKAPTKGQVTVLVFWAQYHKPGYKYLPFYSQLQAKYGDQVSIVGVSVDPNKDYPAKFLEDPKKKYSAVFTTKFAVAFDVGSKLKDAFASGLRATLNIPHAFVVDASGNVVWHQDHSAIGATTATYMHLMEKQIDNVLKGAKLESVGAKEVESDSDSDSGSGMEMGDFDL